MYVTTDRVLELDNFETKCYEMTKQLYLGLWASNPKNKTTLFPVIKFLIALYSYGLQEPLAHSCTESM